MTTILSYKISTRIGTAVLVSAMIFNVVSISTNAFTKSLSEIQSSQITQLNFIQEETGENLDINSIDNWSTYSNAEYGFKIKYPEVLTNTEDENKKSYSEDYSEVSLQPLKITFKKFVVRVWNNADDLELKNYLATDEFCAIDKAFCRSFKKTDEIMLIKTNIADNDWYQTINKPPRFFIPSSDNKYFLDFELTKLNYKKEFNKVMTTLEFK